MRFVLRPSFFSIIVFGALLTLVAGCSRDSGPEEEIVRPVVSMTVHSPSEARIRTFSGVAQPAIESNLSFRVAGEIVELPAKVGKRVQKGDLVARLDPTDYELQVREAEADMAQAAAAFNQLKADWVRKKALYESRTISRSEMDQAEASYRSAAARMDAARKRRALAQQQLNYTVLHAPAAGSLAQVPVNVHQTVQAGQIIASLSASGNMEFETAVPERLISRVREGDKAQVRFDSIPGQSFDALAVEVGVQALQLSTFPVTLRIVDEDSRILPGMIGQAEFSFRIPEGAAMIVPPQAVAASPDGARFVWIVDRETMTVQRRDVEVGGLTPEGLEVLDGLEPEDELVIRGVHRLKEGRKVRLLGEEG
ncbi:RND family efflux transporter, MFP subunit [Paucidesulfovibrio gracilis DSM 16080]|uniref:RND family efflux transporter, MFP subunit n=1 Tax=Paucidesulfovibrio gracilis DSM 16080 TaxID=1121449 RepID=A0A1T4Y6K8_9BACT|nr:efflux RND transporter periplasmic adaptor subunit [Paucidesulfovibrio gracilis]SKA96931.1 RND family efflux transporter, MFP subunit [Paucidesulfovibrio gracilis DSM 16080]